jgi:D-glycero-D-manno-heptose 1,7-bisphosphate phosphatase
MQKVSGLFLDRDGVVIQWVDYISDPNLVVLVNGITDLIQSARKKNMKVFIITNQSGIGRGLFGWPEYHAVTDRMNQLLAEKNVSVDKIYVSPFFKDAKNEDGQKGEELRKPNPGMLYLAQSEFDVDLASSVLVGDSASDIEAGFRSGLSNLYFLENERSHQELPKLDKNWSTQIIKSLNEVRIT